MQELSIKVNIADRNYPLKIHASDEETVRKAARKLNERLREYTENFAVSDKQDALAMIALEFATEYLSQEGVPTADTHSLELLRNLENELDRTLKNP